MFDKKTNSILTYLESQCPSGAYRVLDKNDILQAMPEKLDITLDDLESVIEFLEQSEYIVTKYQDDVQVCITLTPKAHSALMHNIGLVAKPKVPKKTYWFVGLLAFFGAFLGTVVGSFLGF